jgi:hypothetical protein
MTVGCAADTAQDPRPPVSHGGATGKGDAPAGFWWVGATVAPAVPNSGIRTTFGVVNSPPPIGCVDSWASETLANGIWGQVGYAACNVDGAETFTGFYQVYSGALELVDGEIPMTEGLHSFSMALTSGTTWTFTLDGQAFGALDMGTAAADGSWSQIVTEEGNGVPAPYPQPAIEFPEAISVLQDGVWMQPGGAVVYNSAGVPGVIGNLQDPTLGLNAISMPGSEVLPTNTPLWDGPLGTTTYTTVSAASGAPFAMLDSPAAGSTVSGTVTLQATATSTSGIANVTFWVPGHRNAPACVVTAAPFTCDWDTTIAADGTRYVTIFVTDTAGQQTSLYDTMIVRNHPNGG